MTDFNSKQYKRVIAVCKERDKIPTQAWTPDKPKDSVSDEKINFEEDSEYKRMFDQHTDAMKQQSELIEHWVKKEEKKRPSPMPPMTPFEGV